MSVYFLSGLSRFHKIAVSSSLSSARNQIVSYLQSRAVVSGLPASFCAFCSAKQDGFHNDVGLGSHDSVKKGKAADSVKKGKTPSSVKKGKTPDSVQKGETNEFKPEIHTSKKKKRDFIAKDTARKRKVPAVVALCNARSVSEITRFPPEVLKDNRRVRQLFNAWKKEWYPLYDSKEEENMRFQIFKSNLFEISQDNESSGRKSTLAQFSDHIPGYNRPIKYRWAKSRRR